VGLEVLWVEAAFLAIYTTIVFLLAVRTLKRGLA
jgi:hypothetical protein